MWVELLAALEKADLDATPRMMLAEGYQGIMEGKLQRDIRSIFETAEMECRQAYHGKYEPHRMGDPMYKLTAFQLWMAAGYWTRMFYISADPLPECSVFLHTKYTADIRRDEALSHVFLRTSSDIGRRDLNDDELSVIAETLLLERDMYGHYRFERRSDQQFFMQSLLSKDVGHNDDTSGVLQLRPVVDHGNFVVEVKEKYDGRWRNVKVSCGDEAKLAPPWREEIVVDVSGHDLSGRSAVCLSAWGPTGAVAYRHPTLDRASLPSSAAVAEVIYNEPLVLPREDVRTLDGEAPFFEFELANIQEDHSLFGRLCRRYI